MLTADAIDTRDMVLIHTVFRRELRLAARVVRRTAARDRNRAGEVAKHLDYLLWFLEHHHTIEDELSGPCFNSAHPRTSRRWCNSWRPDAIARTISATRNGLPSVLSRIRLAT